MSKKITDVIEISGVLIGIGLIVIIGSVIRFFFTSSIINLYIICIGIVLSTIGLLIHNYKEKK
jgi:UDP-N-acetylmuramyl pentapeptide phosphotransferase/UDP-N-acetylglucosamine-1-phosphate transferase